MGSRVLQLTEALQCLYHVGAVQQTSVAPCSMLLSQSAVCNQSCCLNQLSFLLALILLSVTEAFWQLKLFRHLQALEGLFQGMTTETVAASTAGKLLEASTSWVPSEASIDLELVKSHFRLLSGAFAFWAKVTQCCSLCPLSVCISLLPLSVYFCVSLFLHLSSVSLFLYCLCHSISLFPYQSVTLFLYFAFCGI